MPGSINPIPEGFNTANPYLIVKDATAAVEFYTKAFGAITTERLTDNSGRVTHAELKIGTSMIMIGAHKNADEPPPGLPLVSIYLYVANADEVAKAAIDAGAKEIAPVQDQFYGNREGGVKDPFGITWWIASRIQEVTPEEIQKRNAAAREATNHQPKQEESMSATTTSRVTVTPYLCVKNAAEAIEFYKQAFGATELMRLADNTGKVGHAEILIGEAKIMLADEFPELGIVSPQTLGGSPVMIVLDLPDVDSFAAKAVAAGATASRPISDQFYGQRAGQLTDPYGHRWNIGTKTEDLSVDEVKKRAAKLFA